MTAAPYRDFLAAKAALATPSGLPCEPADVHPLLKPHQRDTVVWAVRGGRRAIFADTGLGKTFMQLEWAHGIRETDTLQAPPKRNDERHVAPLQLGVIERCVRLWSNPGDVVLDPFAGIGSTGHEAVRLGRRFLGIELKPEYFEQSVRNLRRAENVADAPTLFSVAAIS